MAVWREFLHAVRPARVAEVGVWRGEFAAAVLAECPFVDRYYLIDPWAHLPDWNKPFNVAAEHFEAIYREALWRTDFAQDRRVILRGRTKEVVHQLEDTSLDFIYVDGDHTLRGITLDLILLFNKARPTGYLGGDDFAPTPWDHGPAFEPTLVFPFAVHFAEAMNAPIRALPCNQFLISRAQTGFEFIDPLGRYRQLGLNPSPSQPGGQTSPRP
jgi:hypothetical protein